MKLISRVLLLTAALVLPGMVSAGTYVSITIAPPALPVYAQPVCPDDGYMWTPGYWAWDGVEYYWVPGTWVLAPAVDVFWTPGYWGWGGGFYAWHGGYWGPHVGFYGGVNYGYGYGGSGYEGGRWDHGHFNYNRAANNINVVNIHNTYNTTIVNNNGGNRVSFNGGEGGIRAQPNEREMAAARDNHIGATHLQQQHEQSARADRSMSFAQNHGNPAVAATQHPVGGDSHGMVHAPSGAEHGAPASSDRSQQGHLPSSGFAPHANGGQGNGVVNDRASTPHSSAPASGNVQHERPQTSGGGMPQGERVERPQQPSQGQMRQPQGGQMRSPQGGGERHGGGSSPRPEGEPHRER